MKVGIGEQIKDIRETSVWKEIVSHLCSVSLWEVTYAPFFTDSKYLIKSERQNRCRCYKDLDVSTTWKSIHGVFNGSHGDGWLLLLFVVYVPAAWLLHPGTFCVDKRTNLK